MMALGREQGRTPREGEHERRRVEEGRARVELPDVRSAVLGGLAGACLCALLVLVIIDWLTGLHNSALTLGLVVAALVLAGLAVMRMSWRAAGRSVLPRIGRPDEP